MRGIELIYKPVMVRDEEKGSLGSSPSGTTERIRQNEVELKKEKESFESSDEKRMKSYEKLTKSGSNEK